jgi:uncharacterized protein (DUF58 family)
LRKINTFSLVAGGLAEDLLSGDFRSIFKGQGIEFDEVRRYETGDDIRAIDWNVSARFGTPYVKMYREEREITVFILLDGSMSMYAATRRYEQALLAAALTAFSAERSGQRVGAVFFDRRITSVFSPRKGRAHIMAMISAALGRRPSGRGSDLGAALAGAGRILKRRSLVVIISDFLCLNWEKELGNLCGAHDVIALRITAPLDTELPDLGLLSLRDDETGRRVYAPTGLPSFRAAWSEWQKERRTLWRTVCRSRGAAAAELSTGEDAAAVLRRFFGGRKRL